MQSIKTRAGSDFRKIEEQGEVDGLRKLAIVSSHPIQYNAPLFRYLAADKRLSVKVFYTWSQSQIGLKYDPEFRRDIQWDIPLLEGYEYEFVKNTARKPGSHHFWGIVNPGLSKKILDWQPDTVVVYGWNFHSHLKLIRELSGKVPLGFRGDSHLLSGRQGLKAILKNKLLRWIYSKIDFAYYVGSYNRSYFLHYGMEAKQLVFVPHAVDNKRFRWNVNRVEERASQWRSELGIGKKDTVFLYAGKFIMKKNLFFLIQSFNKLKVNNVKLVLAGSGILEKVLRKIAEGNENILFLDFQNQSMMPVLYRMADVFVLPSSNNETWGLGINEAMASGNAIICSDQVGCAPDLVINGGNGFVVGANDEEGMVRAMTEFSINPQLLENCKQVSAEIIEEWSIEKAYKKMADHICSLPVREPQYT